VAGVLWGSHDEGGLRQFPFAVFCVVPESRTFTHPLVALDYLRIFEQHAGEIRRNYQSAGALQAFYSVYRGLRIDLPARPPDQVEAEARDALKQITIEEFAGSIPGISGPKSWGDLMSRMRNGLKSTEHDQDGAVRFPTGDRLRPSVQMQFWLLWALGFSSSKKAAGPTGVLFESRAYEAGRGTFLFRPLRPDDLLLLHPTHTDYEFVEEIGATSGNVGSESERSPGSSSEVGEWGQQPMASLLGSAAER
jgi:hypothetical protein